MTLDIRSTPPPKAKVLVIGGGPGGSYSATCLAREGCDVVLLEAAKFPRYHVGESMISSMRNFLRFIDFLDEFEAHGFYRKQGAAFKLTALKKHGFTDFCAQDPTNHAWNVDRAQSDELLLRYASRCGVQVFEETRVTEIEFDGPKPVAALWKNATGDVGKISFDYVVDSSGRNGIISTKYLKSRVFNPSFKNIAIWGYWEGVNTYKPESAQANFPFFEALIDNSGWAWFIPLASGKTSVGVVTNQEASIKKKAQLSSPDAESYYRHELTHAPELLSELIGDGRLIQEGLGTSIKQASDYSYSSSVYAGPHYRLVGDAACFIDPFFSSGVHLALSGALSAAATIMASIRGECTEAAASSWHHSRVDTSYTRFLVVVLTAYRQICNQETSILSEISEEGFDRAFDHFCTIIQGQADVAKSLADAAPGLRQTIDFCKNAFTSDTDPEDGGLVAEITPSSPSLKAHDSGHKEKDTTASSLDAAAKDAFTVTTAMRFMTSGESFVIDNIVSEGFDGLQLRIKKGSLGLALMAKE